MNFFKKDLNFIELESLLVRLDKLDIFLNEYYSTHYKSVDDYISNSYLGYAVSNHCICYNKDIKKNEKRKMRELQGTLIRPINIEVINNFSFFMGKNKWVYVNLHYLLDKSKTVSYFSRYTDDFKLLLMNISNLIFLFGYKNVVVDVDTQNNFDCFEYLLCLDEGVDVETLIVYLKKEIMVYEEKYNFTQSPTVMELKTSNDLSNFFKGVYWFNSYPSNCIFYTYPHFNFVMFKFNYSVLEYYALFNHVISIGTRSNNCVRLDAFVFSIYCYTNCLCNGLKEDFNMQNMIRSSALYLIDEKETKVEFHIKKMVHVINNLIYLSDNYQELYKTNKNALLSLEVFNNICDNLDDVMKEMFPAILGYDIDHFNSFLLKYIQISLGYEETVNLLKYTEKETNIK